ncbi:unnamed protein product [Rhizoctonia solani]|uniref:Uncharacterized protein n=1 Tax=Rhizoctonia solani TaxID=456999 RepID=A0A8H3E2B1_9AGAM|nr:unnamed protein product [Rhizoctonia solani]
MPAISLDSKCGGINLKITVKDTPATPGEQMETDLEKATEEVGAARIAVQESQDQIRELKTKRDKVEKARAIVAAKLDEERAALKAYQTQLDAFAKQIARITQRIADVELEVKTTDHELTNATKDKAALEGRITELEKLNPWFEDERRYAFSSVVWMIVDLLGRNFGKPGGEFHFATMDMTAIKETARRAEDQSKSMKRKVNSKVMHMIEGYGGFAFAETPADELSSVEKKDKELQERITMVQKDRMKIEATIEELDKEKMAALEHTWTKVNEQFGQIFAELLPSNFAKLQPPEGKELTDGLEVKVRLGQVWKHSLTELSGGQRYGFLRLFEVFLIKLRIQLARGPLTDHGLTSVQAGADVYS